jgi:hypothetical protein
VFVQTRRNLFDYYLIIPQVVFDRTQVTVAERSLPARRKSVKEKVSHDDRKGISRGRFEIQGGL